MFGNIDGIIERGKQDRDSPLLPDSSPVWDTRSHIDVP